MLYKNIALTTELQEVVVTSRSYVLTAAVTRWLLLDDLLYLTQEGISSVSFEILDIVDLHSILGHLGRIILSFLPGDLPVQDCIRKLVRNIILNKTSDVPSTILTGEAMRYNVIHQGRSNLNRKLLKLKFSNLANILLCQVINTTTSSIRL